MVVFKAPYPQLEVAGKSLYTAAKATPWALESTEGSNGVAVFVVGWDEYDSYAYTGGMGLAVINPVVK